MNASPGPPRSMTMATAEGSYMGTTPAMSRHDRAAAAGGGVRQPATMLVDESSVRWQLTGADEVSVRSELTGADEVRIDGARLQAVSLERVVASSVLRRPSIVVVSWHADNGDLFATAFLPSHHVETHDLVRAVERLMTRVKDSTDQGHEQSHEQDETTPDGPL